MERILIVDDEAIIRESMRDVVDWSSLGIEVAGCVSNGLEALSLIEKETVSIIITDIKMPYMDGLALLEALSQRGKAIPTIILSGYDDFRYAQTAIQYGVVNYLLKPVKLDELYHALKNICERLNSSKEANFVSSEELTRFRTTHRGQLREIRSQLCQNICNVNPVEIRRLCQSFCDLFENNGYSYALLVRSVFRCIYLIADETERFIQEDLNDVIDLQEMQELFEKNNISDVRQVFTNILLTTSETVGLSQFSGQRQAIRFVLQKIQQEYSNPSLNLADIADKYGITANYLSTLFKKETGVTFTAYLENFRMDKAKELLLGDTAKVYEIANAVGYPDAHYFAKVFKAALGRTPQEYRNHQ